MASNNYCNSSNSGCNENQRSKTDEELHQICEDAFTAYAEQNWQEFAYTAKPAPMEQDELYGLNAHRLESSSEEPSLQSIEDISELLSLPWPDVNDETPMQASSPPELSSLEVPMEPLSSVEHRPSPDDMQSACYPAPSQTPYPPQPSPPEAQNQIQAQPSPWYQPQSEQPIQQWQYQQPQHLMPPLLSDQIQTQASPCYQPQSEQPIQHQQWQHEQYLMPPLPTSETVLMPPPSTLPPRPQIRVIRPVMKKRPTKKTPTASQSKPYTTKAPAKRGNTKTSAPAQSTVQSVQYVQSVQAADPSQQGRTSQQQPTFSPIEYLHHFDPNVRLQPAMPQPQATHHLEATSGPQSAMPQPQIPINPIQQQHPTNANGHILQPLQIPRAFDINTNGWHFPNVPQEGGSIRIVTNVPKGPMYPTVQLMNTGTTTIPVLLYEGYESKQAEIPLFMEDVNRTRLPINVQFVIPPTVVQKPVDITYTFSNNFTASLKIYLC